MFPPLLYGFFCREAISRQSCHRNECLSIFWLRQSFIFCLERCDHGSIHKDKLHFTDKLMNKIPDICFLLFAICYGLHWGGIQAFRHPRFQKPQKVRFSHNANGVYFYSVEHSQECFLYDNCDFSPSEVNLARPTKSLSFDLEHPVLVINDLIPSPQDLEAEARYVLSIISPWCISHCHMALSLIFEVEQIITQLAIGKMWRYHILPIQILYHWYLLHITYKQSEYKCGTK